MVPQKSGRALLIGFGILSLIFIGLLKSGCPSGIFVISFLLFITGFLVSGIFTFASLIGVKDQKTVVSPLYAADLLGGCVGSLVLIPFFGMELSAIMMTVLALAALFIL